MEEHQLELTRKLTIPPHETPAYRLAEHSAQYLSDTELLSLLLNGKIGTERSLQTARNDGQGCCVEPVSPGSFLSNVDARHNFF